MPRSRNARTSIKTPKAIAKAPTAHTSDSAPIIGKMVMNRPKPMVTADVPDFAIVAGVPARVIGDVRKEK